MNFISQEMAIKNIYLLMSTIREILKKLKANGTIKNLPERGPMFTLPPHTVRGMIREANNSPRISAGK